MAVGDIYDSSAARDYVSLLTNRLDRELVYWFAPEMVFKEGWWIAQVLAIIEIIVLLSEQKNIWASDYFGGQEAVKRWRKVFLEMWDEDWEKQNQYGYPYCYDEIRYRKQHRPEIINLFDRLEYVIYDWSIQSTSKNPPPPPSIHEDYPLPHFSVQSEKRNDGSYVIGGNPRFIIWNLIQMLQKDIIFSLSAEKRAEVVGFNDPDAWIAADLLAFICENYRHTPGVNEKVVQNWRQQSIDIRKAFAKADHREFDETESYYQEIIGVFDHLQAVVKQYPPDEWWLE